MKWEVTVQMHHLTRSIWTNSDFRLLDTLADLDWSTAVHVIMCKYDKDKNKLYIHRYGRLSLNKIGTWQQQCMCKYDKDKNKLYIHRYGRLSLNKIGTWHTQSYTQTPMHSLCTLKTKNHVWSQLKVTVCSNSDALLDDKHLNWNEQWVLTSGHFSRLDSPIAVYVGTFVICHVR